MTRTRSAAATGLPATDPINLESAIMDLSAMTGVAHAHLTRAFGFDKAKAPKLSDEDSHLVYWSICQCAWMVEQVEVAFQQGGGR